MDVDELNVKLVASPTILNQSASTSQKVVETALEYYAEYMDIPYIVSQLKGKTLKEFNYSARYTRSKC